MLDWLTIAQTAFNRDDQYSLLYNILVNHKDYYEVMQFTGLLDKNGKEIYEGDITRHERRDKPFSSKAKKVFVDCLVEWDDGISDAENKKNPASFNRNPGFHAYPINRSAKGANWGYNFSEFHDCEVIGNIYQTPELLTPPLPKE